jgi:uncharacterized protein YfaS (alpha-2-macroglobulin family)
MPFYVGETVRGTRVFTNFAGVVADPATVSLTVKKPLGTTTTYTYAGGTITKTAIGTYHKDIDLDEDGRWQWRWATTGDPAEVAQGSFRVLPSNV